MRNLLLINLRILKIACPKWVLEIKIILKRPQCLLIASNIPNKRNIKEIRDVVKIKFLF